MTQEGSLGRVFEDGQVIVRQGEPADCMYVIQEGQVEALMEKDGKQVRINLLGQGEFFGEMAIFERTTRMATVRAVGRARVLTVDKKNFLARIHEDPSIAYRMVQEMSKRIRKLSDELAAYKGL